VSPLTPVPGATPLLPRVAVGGCSGRSPVSGHCSHPRTRRQDRAPGGALPGGGLAPLVLLTGMLLFAGCGFTGSAPEPPLFERLAPEVTGIAFVNELPETADFNILNYLYYYNGGGVAVGDINNNGLPDLYFTSNLGPNRLYLNQGDYRFHDVTDHAGVAGTAGWTTGVTMADVDGDGWIDIYVSTVDHLDKRSRNLLYINNGDGTFTERAEEYGLAHVGYSTQAVFFDYDGDGDLDMFLLNHAVHTERSYGTTALRAQRHQASGDKLYRNDGGRFVDVSAEAGIIGGAAGYGLGVVVSDLNDNGCPDIFVANDFHENDFLYYNNCDGTFTESITSSIGHTSRFSMGTDAADFTNNGRPDLVVVDMLPEREDIYKTSAGAESYDIFRLKLRYGYHPQYARNTLQMNRGDGVFSEIGYLAGVYATDWSWSALFADLDNDGFKDLFITNGIYRRPNDLDYINFISNDAIQASLEKGITEENLSLLGQMPQIPIPNYAYRNNGDLTFTNRASAWGLGDPGFSNGAVYVDLNNDGALDLVVNNINAPAAVYRNRSRELNGNNYLKVILHGEGGNTGGIGAKVIIRGNGQLQMLEQMPTRGFQSSVDPRLHFGLGRHATIDTLVVVWPDRRYQLLERVAANQILILRQEDAAAFDPSETGHEPLFEQLPLRWSEEFRHRENDFIDFNREPFIPHKLSTEGPALAVGDVNGNGLDDFFIGGAKWQAGALYMQRPDGSFVATNRSVFQPDSLSEDVTAVFFDANGNGHLDLYVGSGGNEFWGEQEPLRDRIYLNDGVGTFRRATEALPDFFGNTSTVVAADFDGDGHTDLFVGSRVVTNAYGTIPRSYLLRNDGAGRFTDVTDALAPDLAEAGMVTDAAWIDYNGNGLLDLVVVGEWMPVRIFEQLRGSFVDRTTQIGLGDTYGWWNSVHAADLDGDGNVDLVLGNLGWNSFLRAAPEQPLRMYVAEFTGDGKQDQMLTFYRDGVSYPVAMRDDLVKRSPPLRKRYPTYAAFSDSRLEEIFPASVVRSALVREARTFASAVARNTGNGTFAVEPLPTEAQFAPVFAVLAEDFDGDGAKDLLLAGNFYGVTPVRGRYNASLGTLLKGDGAGGFTSVDWTQLGVRLDGQVRAMRPIRTPVGLAILVARNDEVPILLRPRWQRTPPDQP
jgi:enediyne biosynthesis protein E4